MAGEEDPHFNLFHAYRGPSPNAAARARQLEDNLTRALAITLKHLRGTVAAQQLLAELCVPAKLRSQPFEIRLQVPAVTTSWPAPHQRKLVAIVAGQGEAEPMLLSRDVAPAARPDMVLMWEHYALVVESEVTPAADFPQMAKMSKAFETAASGSSFDQTTWHRLSIAARGPHKGLSGPQTLVITEFEEYLRMNGFGGFADEHFTYFALSPEDRAREVATRVGVRRALANLLGELREQWATTWSPQVGHIHAEDLGAWGKLQAPGSTSPHLSIGVGTAGIDILANIETQHPFVQFRKAWHNDPGRFAAFFEALGSATNDQLARSSWSLDIHRRVQQHKESGQLLPMKFWYLPAVTLSASAAVKSPAMMTAAVNEAVNWGAGHDAAPQISIIRHYDRADVLQPRLVDRLAADARALEQFFDWLGQPVR